MPLDSAAYLSSLGWQGTGNGLRKGGMIKPLAIPQKRTLAGVGKDRDEAFPFWDHVFNAAANSIKIKIHNDSDQSDVESEQPNAPKPALSRTSTGIISNRRPTATTPNSERPKESDGASEHAENKYRLTLLAEAKRRAAHTRLYAAFYRGLVIPPIDEQVEIIKCEAEKKTQEKNVADCDTLPDSDIHIRREKDKSSKKHKKSTDDSMLEKENTSQTTKILDSKKRKKEARIEESDTENGPKRSKTKRRRDSVIEHRESLTEEKNLADLENATCDQEDLRNRKKLKKIKERKELLKQSDKTDIGDTMHEEKKRKKKKDKHKRDKNS